MWRRKLAQDERQVKRTLSNKSFNNAKRIGLVAYIHDEEHLKRVEDFLHHLQRKNKEVNLLAFVPQKEVPHYCMPKLSVDYVPKKNINWYGIPHGKSIRDFQNRDFDVLIDLCLEHRKEVLYIAATSAASMRVGLFEEGLVRFYDFMISSTSDNRNNIDKYISEVEKYLYQINPGQNE